LLRRVEEVMLTGTIVSGDDDGGVLLYVVGFEDCDGFEEADCEACWRDDGGRIGDDDDKGRRIPFASLSVS
jgi:hypothetical protein